MSTPAITLYAKAGLDGKELGDCPFTQRVGMTLQLKGLPFTTETIDVSNKPEWFLALNPKGTVPVLRYDSSIVPDSDVICELLEQRHPEPRLYPVGGDSAEKLKIGAGIHPAFAAYFKNRDVAMETGLQEKLISELVAFEGYLENGEKGDPRRVFILGDSLSAGDLIVGPRIRIAAHVIKKFKGWDILADPRFPAISGYVRAFVETEAYKSFSFRDEVMEHNWGKFLQ